MALLFAEPISPLAVALLAAGSFLTSATTAAFGIGGGVAMLALLSYFMPVAALIPVHGAIQLASNSGRLYVQRRFVSWNRAAPFIAGTVVGAAAGAALVFRLEEPVMKTALGLFVLATSWVSFPVLASAGTAIFVLGGTATAFASMFFGATGPLVAIFFANAFADRRQYSGTHAAVMAFQHGAKIAAFAFAGFAFAAWLPLIAAMAATGYLGTVVGARMLSTLDETRFRQIFRWLITAIALDMIRRGALAWMAN
jgi:uncharacterized protein